MKNVFVKYFLLPFTIFFINNGQRSQAQVPIKSLGIEQGLSNNSVRCIYQDRNGFIWLGTHYGLNRYDGYEFKVFTNELSDTNSLPHNYIYTVHEDKNRNLWVATGQALSVYNNVFNNFSPVYYLPYQIQQPRKINFGVQAISSDNEGNVYLGSDELGLLVIRKNEKNALPVPFQIDSKETIHYRVRAISVIQNHVWLLIRDWGLGSYDANTGKVVLVNSEVKDGNCLQWDSSNNIWIGAEKGLYKYDIAMNRNIEAYTVNPGQLNPENITSICLNKDGKLWIGTERSGVAILDTNTKSFTYILPGEGKNSLGSESVNSIISDNEGRIWIGTLRGGCNIIDEGKNNFTLVSRTAFTKNSLPSNFIYSFCEDNDHDLLIGTDGGGLSVWNRDKNTFQNYKHDNQDPNSLSHNSLASIKRDSYGDIWIGTFGGGINKFNKSKGTFQHYACINEITKSEDKIVWWIYEDRKRDLWACTYGNGKLYKLNRSLDRFEVFRQDFNNLFCMTEDSRGNLWAGNSSQLIKIDRDLQHNDKYFDIGKPVRSIYEDKRHNLWLGIEGGGLILFDPNKWVIIDRLSEQNGLCNNAVLNILEDSTGCLWLSTFNGLSKFDPSKKSFKNFYQSDGLQSNQFSYRAALMLHTGEMVFGGIRGFNIFYPHRVAGRNYMPPVFLTDIAINNKPVHLVKDEIVRADSARILELKIPYDESFLSFRFNALEYSSPEKISYAYFLEGWDKTWNYSGNDRTINYNNIREGTYTLHVKSTNAEGVWNNNEATLSITVLPPWYRTWWAYLLYVGIALSLIYLYLWYRTRQTRLEYEVKLAHLETVKEKELNEKKIAFFTDISHEFRTPLTLIINPIKDILKNNGKKTDADLNIIYRSSRRLLSLVDQLLLFQKAGTESDTLKVSKLDFTAISRNVYQSFVNLAKSKKLDYQFIVPREDLELYGDKEKIEIISFNLLSNAIKYTPDSGKVVFEIKESDKEIELIIADSGPGIPESVGNKIFERFYQVKESTAVAKPGIGIGLYLVKHFAEQHGGLITYQSNTSEGTIFKVSFLKGSAHFANTVQLETCPTKTLADEIIEEEETITESEVIKLDELVSDKKSILIVEDNEEVRNYVAGIFKDRFKVYEADSGKNGFESTQKYLPDIVISDVMMENGNGIELCHNIKSDDAISHTPVILLTAVGSSDVKLKGVETGADDYIIKPFEKDLLLARVENLLKTRNRLQNYFYNEITLKKHDLKISSEYKVFLERCIAIVEEHLDDDGFSIGKFAGLIGMSHSNLYRKVKSISGQSINAFIRFIRLRKAAELMIKSTGNINEIAFQVGISDVKYFRKQFQILFGMNPSEYIRKYRAPFNKDFIVNEKVTKSEI